MTLPELVQKVSDITAKVDALASTQGMLELAYSRVTRSVSANTVNADETVDPVDGATKTHGLSTRVETTETPIPHHLGHTPTFVGFSPRANAIVWQSREADQDYIYLQASTAVDVNWTAEV